MLCPKCNGALIKCIDSRLSGARTRRRHLCIKCGHRFSTLEITVEDYHGLKHKEELLDDVLAYYDKIKEKLKGNTNNENESNA